MSLWFHNWKWVIELGLTTLLVIGLGFFYLFRPPNWSCRNRNRNSRMGVDNKVVVPPVDVDVERCAMCGNPTSKQCAACKSVKYCSQTCQVQHWKSEHKRKCKELQSSSSSSTRPFRTPHIALIPSSSNGPTNKLLHKVLFPYHDFLNLFNSHQQIFPPCGLLNCGNSCFANVVLQCLTHTRPLLAYLLAKGHQINCRRNEWCFLCELQTHMERASRCQQPFSPINILSRLPTIGANMGYGKQEDAHEFIRFAIDKMQSVCLDEHGGEKLIHPKSQETTLIQHIFGGHLQSQVVCTQCNQVSRQYENMMDLTVEIQGDATSLEECLDQFTMKEWLHGDNLYKCDGCNDYVRAWKRLTIHQSPNILTIALKRFQSGRFGKINKKITFPENLDLSPYMSEGKDGSDIYKLYAVIVHVDMLNASFFGHYICYTKGFQGNWYRIDDCKVMQVELDEVLSQGAYMLMYSRVSARPTCLQTFESATKQKQENEKVGTDSEVEHNSPILLASSEKPMGSDCSRTHALCPDSGEELENTGTLKECLLTEIDCVSVNGDLKDSEIVNSVSVETLENGDYSCEEQLTLNADRAHSRRVGLSSGEQSNSKVAVSSALGVDAACDTSYNASGVDSMSLDGCITANGFAASKGKLVGNGSEAEPSESGNDNNKKIAGMEGGRNVSVLEETSDIGNDLTRQEYDISNDSEMSRVCVRMMKYADDMELDESDGCSSGAADAILMNGNAVSIGLDPPEKSSRV